MSYQEYMNYLLGNGFVSYVIIFDPEGNTYWSNNPNWAVDGKALLRTWQDKMAAIEIAGTKYSTIVNRKPDYLIGKNIRGGGTVIVARAPNGYFFLTWTSADSEYPATNIHAEVSRMAGAFR